MSNETANPKKIRIGVLILALLIPLLTGVFSAYLTSSDMDLYENMNRPPLSPPGWLFPIVWTILYLAIGFASYLVYTSGVREDVKRTALLYYAAQLIMNFFWSTLFFTYGQYLISLIWLLGMWVLIFICGMRFYKINRWAGLIMGLLFLWTTFAAYLNLGTFVLSLTPAAA